MVVVLCRRSWVQKYIPPPLLRFSLRQLQISCHQSASVVAFLNVAKSIVRNPVRISSDCVTTTHLYVFDGDVLLAREFLARSSTHILLNELTKYVDYFSCVCSFWSDKSSAPLFCRSLTRWQCRFIQYPSHSIWLWVIATWYVGKKIQIVYSSSKNNYECVEKMHGATYTFRLYRLVRVR